jgi:hypothetical protein
MASVLVLSSRKRRAKEICPELVAGARRSGYRVQLLWADQYREPITDILMHYGFDGSRDSIIAKAHEDYKRAGLKAIYVDLGYFKNRAALGRYGDYHRFSINARHPDAYFQNVKHPGDRAAALRVRVAKRITQGRKIVVCGCSTKASAFDRVVGWEEQAITELRRHTDRPIVYRPKPQRAKYGQLPPIAGTEYSHPMSRKLEHELVDAWAVVSHHSNAGLDALVAGVPCFQVEGVALSLGLDDLSKIETPRLPDADERQQLVNDVCYTQWNGREYEQAWLHFKYEGLVP